MAFVGGNFVEGGVMDGNMVVGGEGISIGDNFVGGAQVAFPPGEGISTGGNFVEGGVGVAFPPGEGISTGANFVEGGVGIAFPPSEGIAIGGNFVEGGPHNVAMFSGGAVAEGEEPAEEEEKEE